MIGLIVELTYPNHKHTTTTWFGTSQSGQAAKSMLSMKNGAQHKTNVKKTSPSTFDAFCSFATELAAIFFLFARPVSNLKHRNFLV